MHRQNTYQGNSGGSWSTVGGDASGSTRPKHLRGKQIGLYYRDKAMRGRSQGQAKLPPEVFQAEKERRKRIRSAITLRIPPKVLDTMNKNLESIEKVAQGLNITILPVKGLEEIKARTKVKDSSKNMNTSFSEDNDSNVDWFLDGETAKDIDPDNVNNKEEDVNDFWETSSVEEDVMWNISSDFEEHKSQKKPKITGPDGRSTDLTGDHDTPSRCETNVDQNDADSKKSEILMKADVFKKPKMVLKTPAKKDIGQSSTSLDFIPVDTESPQDYGSAERLYSLRGGGDYKYGYHDIITGTFDEKLDECLAKGIAINTSTDEIKDLNVALYEDYKNMQTRERFRKMMKFREMLPTYKKTQELLDVITNNQVVVISGETGCGKSTQVPQIILDDAICKNKGGNCKIVVTQPRRIAASSLAKRVSEERGERIGESVGYAVRLEKKDPRPRGSIFFVTTGILLADLEVNQGLTNYSHVILDEVHERDCHIDLSMCLLKKVLRKRKDLKLILMSATIDADTLSRYFDDCPMMHIEGLAYPVKDVYLEEILQMTGFELPEDKKPKQHKGHRGKWKRRRGHNDDIAQEVQYRAEVGAEQNPEDKPEENYFKELSTQAPTVWAFMVAGNDTIGPWLEAIKHKLDRNVFWTLLDHRIETLNMDLITALLIHICNGPPGAILVFLPGIGDIAKLIRLMGESGKFPENRYQIYSLHSKLPSLEQHRIFERPPGDVRKIIIATNIAETSITIDDIVYVVDCAKIKITGLQVDQNICTLKTEWVSQANLRQRRGRAGRCQPGVCYHVVSSFRATRLEERLLPELQRSNLLEPVLTIKRLRLGKAEDALKTVPSPPDPSTVKWAVQHLQQCGALDESETLTPLGWHLARLPVHPSAGKLLLLGSLFGCLDRAASVAAVWGFKDPFQLVIGKEAEVEAARRRLALGEPSDQVAISEAVIRWERQGSRQRSFAYEHFLSNNTLELLSEMKHQLGDNLKQMGFLATGDVKSSWENRNADNLSLFKAIVAASLYPNFAMVRWINLHSDGRKQIRCCASDPHSRDKLQIHPSSVMALPPNSFGRKGPIVKLCNNPGANWLVYWLKQRTVDIYLFEVTLVYTLPLLFFGEVKVVEDEDETPETRTEADCVLSISGVKVRCTSRTAELLFRFRSLLDQVLASKVGVESNRATRRCHFEDAVLNAVIELITAEDERAEYLGGNGSESDHSEYEGGSSQSWR